MMKNNRSARIFLRIFLPICLFPILLLGPLTPLSAGGHHLLEIDWQEIKWQSLVPKSWDPAKELRALNLSGLDDNDPRAIEALQQLKKNLENAPTEPSLNGRRIRISGFVIPLDKHQDKASEFLIVPYFGACIHTPPPPVNQIIFARSATPLTDITMMSRIWTYGTLSIKKSNSPFGPAGYFLAVDRIDPS